MPFHTEKSSVKMKLALFGLLLALALSNTDSQEVKKREPRQLNHPLFYPFYYDVVMPRTGLNYQYPTNYEPQFFDFGIAKTWGDGQGRNSNSKESSSASEPEQLNLESESDAGRFLYGSNIGTGLSVPNNFLIKTSYAFTTSTATVCSLISCIPAGKFAAGSSNVLCRRRRDIAEVVSILNDARVLGEDQVSPSLVEKMETSQLVTLADPNFQPVPEDRQMMMSPYPILLEASMEDGSIQNDGQWNEHRQKRFAFILTTTVTSYELTTATYTVTIIAADDEALVCRPSRFSVC